MLLGGWRPGRPRQWAAAARRGRPRRASYQELITREEKSRHVRRDAPRMPKHNRESWGKAVSAREITNILYSGGVNADSYEAISGSVKQSEKFVCSECVGKEVSTLRKCLISRQNLL